MMGEPLDILNAYKRNRVEQSFAPSISHILQDKDIKFVPDVNVEKDPLFLLAKNVGKLCVFSDEVNREPVRQGTVIRLSETNDLFITAKHVIYPPEPSGGFSVGKELIYVHFDNRPLIPENREMKDGGWIPLQRPLDKRNVSLVSKMNCDCVDCWISDFIFLRRIEPCRVQCQISHNRLNNGEKVALIGFFDTQCTGTLEDFFSQTGLSKVPDKIKKVIIEKRQYQKLISYQRDQHPVSGVCSKPICNLYLYDCVSAEGFSGAMVVSQSSNKLCAIHIGKDSNMKGIGINVEHFMDNKLLELSILP